MQASKQAYTIKTTWRNWKMKWDERWINSMKWSWFKVPVKVAQINEYLFSDTVQSQEKQKVNVSRMKLMLQEIVWHIIRGWNSSYTCHTGCIYWRNHNFYNVLFSWYVGTRPDKKLWTACLVPTWLSKTRNVVYDPTCWWAALHAGNL